MAEVRKHILQICPRLNSGGIERGVVDTAIAIKNAGIQSTVLSGGGHLVQELNDAGVTHIKFPSYLKSPLSILKNSKQLHHLIDKLQPGLVHAYSRAPIWTTYCALKSLNIPFVTSCHSPHSQGPLQLKKFYNRAITYGDKIIATSDFIAAYLQKNYKTPLDKIEVIYRGIDTHIFNPTPFTPQKIIALKQYWNIPTDKTILLLPGRITRWKGQDVFIKALQHLTRRHNVHAIIVGRTDSHQFHKELIELINHYQLSNQIQFIDECFDMPSLYALADITLSTSRKAEAFGRIAVEAQAMGSLIIATNLGATKETIIPNQTGFLVTPDDAAGLSQMIEHVLQLSPEQKSVIRHQAKERVASLFSKETMLKKTLALYQSLLTKANPLSHPLES